MSEVKVNKISPRTACGTVTLGDSGDTFTIPSGATITNSGTASGFGATGETSWDTTVKTTGTFTATAGVGYFLNTTGGIITVNLPVGAAGSSVAMADYAGTWQTNNVTVSPNGSEKMGGIAGNVTLSTEGQSVTFVYIDGTQGWVNVLDSTSNVRGPTFVTATVSGACNTLTTVCTNYKVATFLGPGTFCVSCAGCAGGSNTVDYMVVAGGGGGGAHGGGGAGAGGFRESPGTASGCYTASPRGAAPAVALSVPVAPYSITVGGGGPGGCNSGGTAGSNSIFSSITSTGGGYGGGGIPSPTTVGGAGGSGGGGGGGPGVGIAGGAGNTPPFNPVQGTAGGSQDQPIYAGGGGGGAICAGANAVGGSNAGAGGAGASSSITSASVQRAGGGGGSIQPPSTANGAGGAGGGGAGVNSPGPTMAGGINTGGGGGGTHSGPPAAGGAGGSGIVVIRYKFQ
jgi:hypothetical protein